MKRYSVSQLEEQSKIILRAMGSSEADSVIISNVLIAAELRGISSHGMIRLRDYYGLWSAGRLNTAPKITIKHEAPGTALLDGDNSLGMLSGVKAMRLAIEKAAQCGTGWVSVSNSNHYGIAGYYSMMALSEDMIGISMTNANPLVSPTFSTSRMMGTNPIAVAIPASEEPPFVADFATTPIARGKLDIMASQGKSVPHGFVQDSVGIPSNDPSVITRGGSIVPLGSDYEHGSHKGYCLGAIVDIFSALLSGAGFGPFVMPQVSYLTPKEGAKALGHFFGAMRIDAFRPAEAFKSDMDHWIRTFRGATVAEGYKEVLIPGDPERRNTIINQQKGILLLETAKEAIRSICKEQSLKFILQ